jgi:TonB family protein
MTRDVKMALGVSAGLHIMALFAFSALAQDATPPAFEHAIIAELVARGEPKKKKELPRRVRTKKRRSAAQNSAKNEARAAERAAEKALARAEDQMREAELSDEAAAALARLAAMDQTGDDPDKTKGAHDGSQRGTLSEGELKSLKGDYLTRLGSAIKADGNYRISETIGVAERVRLKAILLLRIGAHGETLEVRLESSSGNPVFDRDILAAARSATFPKPPAELVPALRRGIRGAFRP